MKQNIIIKKLEFDKQDALTFWLKYLLVFINSLLSVIHKMYCNPISLGYQNLALETTG